MSIEQGGDTLARTVRFTYTIALPPQADGEQIRIWVPRPRSTPYQQLQAAEVRGCSDVAEAAEAQFGNTGYYFEPPPSTEPRTIELEFVITRSMRRSPPPSDIATADYTDNELREHEGGPYLAANLNVPIDGFIAYQARSVSSLSDYPIERARHVFDHLIETLDYDWAGCTPDRIADLGNLKKACDLRTGTCTEFHGLYVGYLRALGVPAQFSFGFNIPQDKTRGPILGYHCWAEVLLPRIGWFPVDVSEGWKQPEVRDFYFGGLDCHRVEFHVGRDLALVPAQAGPPVDKWIFGHAERNGVPFPLDVSFRFEDIEPAGRT